MPWGSVGVKLDQDWSKLSRIIEFQVGGVPVAPRDVLWFQMPGLGVLRESAGLLLDALNLHASASRTTSVPVPPGILYNEGAEIGDKELKQIGSDFDTARESGGTAVIQSMRYERVATSAADLQLVEALATVDARLARAMNVPVSVVGASPTGGAHAQLYANIVASFVQVVQQAIAPYLRTIEETFSMPGVTPRGQRVYFDTADWLRFAQVATPSVGLDVPQTPEGSTPTP